MSERRREKEEETADATRESVLNRAIDCRARETILSVSSPNEKEFCIHTKVRRLRDAYKTRSATLQQRL